MLNNKKLSTAAGVLAALTATNAAGQTSNWTNSSGGFWSTMANWDAAVPTMPGQSASFGLGSAYTVNLNGISVSIDEIHVTNPDVLVSVSPARTLGLVGAASTNNGIIQLNPNGSAANSFIQIDGAHSISGSGVINLRTSSDNSQIDGAGILTNGAGHTIQGVGQLNTMIVNNGTIAGNIAVSVSGNLLEVQNDVVNNAFMRGESGSILSLEGVTIDQTGGGSLVAANAGFVNVSASDAVILGGTIDTEGTGEFNVLGSGIATFDSVTNGGFIDVDPAGTLNIVGSGLINDGIIMLNRSGSSANSVLTYVESGVLTGSGEVQMRTLADNAQFNTEVGMTATHGASHTIRGVGQLNASLINNGTVSADISVSVSGNELDLRTENKVNNGTMTAEAGSELIIRNIAVDQLGGGALVSNGGEVQLNTATIDGGTYSAPGGGLLRSDNGTQLLSGVTLNGPAIVDAGTFLTVDSDGMTNNSVMQLNPTGSSANAHLRFTESATLDGSGEVQMRTGFANSFVDTVDEAVLTHAANHTIRGVGQVDAALVNNGEIRADSSVSVSGVNLEIQTNDKINNNIMAADAGSNLDIDSITIFQDGEGLGGTLLANEGNIRLFNASIEGGQYLAVGAGVLNTASGSSLLSGVTLNGPSFINAGHTITVDADSLVNNGLMQMNTTGSSANAVLQFTDDSSLTGTGEIQMRTAFTNTQIVTDPSFVVTHTADHTIRGVGNIYAAMDNQGTVIADVSVSVSGNVLDIEGQDKSNSGVMSALSGSILELSTMNLTQTGAGHLLADEGLIRFIGSATVTGGRIEASDAGSFIVDGPATFVDVTNNAPGVVNGGDTLTVSGDGIVNNGFVSVNPNQFSSDGIIAFPADGFFNTAGGGEVRLEADFGNSQIDGPGIVTNGPGHTISGLGTIDTEFVNGGIVAPGKDGIGTLDASGDVTFASFGSMTIEVGNSNQSDTFAISGTANLGGTLDVVTIPAFEIGNQIDYVILTAGNVVGTFDTENLLVDDQLITRILYEPTQVRLVTRCIADTNLDGSVTPTDFTAWVNAFNNNNAVADQNLDGLITPTDFTAWIANFNAGCP
ncbi:MAG: hypothetical protein Phyf2KO_06620 [Phycisphaerales bacterium]